MAMPSWISAGTADLVLNPAPIAPGYPASPQAGDLFVAHVAMRHAGSSTASATGWTAFSFEDNGGVSATNALYLYKWSDGTETGTQPITTTGNSGGAYGQIHLFRNVGGNPDTPNIESVDTNRATSTTPAPDPVITTDINRLAVCITTVGDDTNTTHTLTGGSGGTWAKHTEVSSADGNDIRMLMQTAEMASADTFSGATGTMVDSDAWICRTFAFYSGATVRTTSDNISVSDVIARIGTFLRNVTDSIFFNDAITRTGTFFRNASDVLGLSDTVNALKIIPRIVVDSITYSDTVGRLLTLERTDNDALNLSDLAEATITSVSGANQAVWID